MDDAASFHASSERTWAELIASVASLIDAIACLGSFVFPQLSDFVNSELFTLVAIVPTIAKAVWFLSPVDISKSADRSLIDG